MERPHIRSFQGYRANLAMSQPNINHKLSHHNQSLQYVTFSKNKPSHWFASHLPPFPKQKENRTFPNPTGAPTHSRHPPSHNRWHPGSRSAQPFPLGTWQQPRFARPAATAGSSGEKKQGWWVFCFCMLCVCLLFEN